jgi:hypothetical protein
VLTDRIQRYGQPDYPFPLPGDPEYLAELREAIGSLNIAAGSSSAALAPPARAEAARLRDYLLPMLAAAEAMRERKAGRSADAHRVSFPTPLCTSAFDFKIPMEHRASAIHLT